MKHGTNRLHNIVFTGQRAIGFEHFCRVIAIGEVYGLYLVCNIKFVILGDGVV